MTTQPLTTQQVDAALIRVSRETGSDVPPLHFLYWLKARAFSGADGSLEAAAIIRWLAQP